jgi:hypothetical protein
MQMSGALTYYTQHPVVRWDSVKAVGLAQITRASLGQKRPLYAVLFPFEVSQFLALGGDGQWTQIGAVREVTLWQWRPAP